MVRRFFSTIESILQSFLICSNTLLTSIQLEKAYTILIPTDSAFQRWHPIDWGFYPFSVAEFTENVLRNHFLQLKAPIRMQDIKKATEISKVKTMGGENITFRNSRKYLKRLIFSKKGERKEKLVKQPGSRNDKLFGIICLQLHHRLIT